MNTQHPEDKKLDELLTELYGDNIKLTVQFNWLKTMAFHLLKEVYGPEQGGKLVNEMKGLLEQMTVDAIANNKYTKEYLQWVIQRDLGDIPGVEFS